MVEILYLYLMGSGCKVSTCSGLAALHVPGFILLVDM